MRKKEGAGSFGGNGNAIPTLVQSTNDRQTTQQMT